MEYVLGIDGGGTKTAVVCTDLEGNEVGFGNSGPTNLTTTTIGAAHFNLVEAIRQAIENLGEDYRFKAIVMGLAGMDVESEYQKAYTAFSSALNQFDFDKFELVNDSRIALANGSDKENAVVLISGTGSICFGINDKGETAKTGGMDYLLTDQGSGYYIGRQTLREAVKSFDGRREKTMLEKLVSDHFRINSIGDLKNSVYDPPLNKAEVAGLAPICFEAYRNGDGVAKMIIDHAVSELELLSSTVIKRLRLDNSDFDLVCDGAVMRKDVIGERVVENLKKSFVEMRDIFPENPPVYGAVRVALSSIHE